MQEGSFSAVLCHYSTGSRACWLDVNWEKDVRLFKSLILCSLVVCCLFGCRSLLSCSGIQIGLRESIRSAKVLAYYYYCVIFSLLFCLLLLLF